MALRATIFKASLQIADMDRHYYGSHALTIARHPSETDERMMVRLLAFARHAHEHLAFARGLSEADEPDAWQKDLTGAIEQWIDVGLPDEKCILKASGRSKQVAIYAYGGRGATLWWNTISPKLARLKNLTVINLPPATTQALARLAQRNMQLGCTIEDGVVWLSSDTERIQVPFDVLQAPA
ncbi:MAG: YaeQ family protein [Betaproteobacteria bacterium]|nr:YaeQ family protein [Betaproteobacteria bacterium]